MNADQMFANQFKNLTWQERMRIAAIPNSIKSDSYKYTHNSVYRDDVTAMFAYGLPRATGVITTVFGLQQIILDFLSKPLNQEDVDIFAKLLAVHFGDETVFNKPMWDKIVKECNGYIPVKIRALPEGIRVQGGITHYTVETDPKYPEFRQLASHVETILLHNWYPSTIATNSYQMMQSIKGLQAISSDVVSPGFSVVDFGFRGVPTIENAGVGGLANALYFDASDNIEAVLFNSIVFYNGGVTSYSVRASEHVVQTMYGPTALDQADYIDRIIDVWCKEGKIASVVLDGYNLEREVNYVCKRAPRIKESGARFVCRPDSGNPMVWIPILLKKLAAAFGYIENSKGYKVLNNVAVLWGDGIDANTMQDIGRLVTDLGYSIDCLVFGSGGGLLQKVSRDTFSWAQKGCAYCKTDNVWYPMSKDPITDPGKKSADGRRGVFVSKITGEVIDVDIDNQKIDSSEWIDLLQDVYFYSPGMNEPFIINENFDDIKERARSINPIQTYLKQKNMID